MCLNVKCIIMWYNACQALLRPGRLDRIVYVSLPDSTTREEIFRIQFRKMPTADDVNVGHLVAKTQRYSGAEVCYRLSLF